MAKQIVKSFLNISLKQKLSITPKKSNKISLSTEKTFFYLSAFREGTYAPRPQHSEEKNYSYSDYQNVGLTLRILSKNSKKKLITFYGIVQNQIYKSQINRSNNFFLSYSNKLKNINKNSLLWELKLFYSRLNTHENPSMEDYQIRENKKSYIFPSKNSLSLPKQSMGRHKCECKLDTLYFVVFFLFLKRKNQKNSKINQKLLFYSLKSPRNLFEFLELYFDSDFSTTNIGYRAGRSIFNAIQTFSKSLTLGSNKKAFFQQTYLSHFVSPKRDTKYIISYDVVVKGVLRGPLCPGKPKILYSKLKKRNLI